MNESLHIDYESRSYVQLGGKTSVGVWNYAHHFSTEPTLLSWGYGPEPVDVWRIYKDPMPDKLRRGFEDPKQLLSAWNSTFERYISNFKLGMNLPIERFTDPQASASYLSLPKNLDDVSKILNLPPEFAKDERGDGLIKIFCQPTPMKKKRGEERRYYWRDWNTDPDLWEQFVEYCRQDVVAEREVARRLTLLRVYPLPDREKKIWLFDQRVNDRGMPVNVPWVKKAYKLASRAKEEAIAMQDELTGLENSNSRDQMLGWIKTQGYKLSSLKKEAVASELKFNQNITPLGRKVLEHRKTASSTSYQKMAAILRQVSGDDRLRGQFLYMGSARCGRWSGNAVQLHNMARPHPFFEDLDNVDWARAMVEVLDYDAIALWFKNALGIDNDPGAVLATIKSLIRTAFAPKCGNRLNVCDLNAIETRVAAWVSCCEALLKVFTTYLCLDHPETEFSEPGKCPVCKKKLKGKDPYLDFGSKMTGIPYIKLARDLQSKDPAVKAAAKAIRQLAKPGVLGCVYRLAAGSMEYEKDEDTGDMIPHKTGLWNYAEGMGIYAELDKWIEVVRIFRESYIEIPQMWYALEDAVAEVLDPKAVRVKRELGPGGCIKIDKIAAVEKDGSRRVILRIQLPSGRYLHYMDAAIESTKMPWKDGQGNEVWRPTLVYGGQNQKTKQWSRITSHGGKTFENIVQGIARDVLAESLMKFEFNLDLPICGHVHDEGISETENDGFAPGLQVMEVEMSQSISWAPGLPLGADGFESFYYHK